MNILDQIAKFHGTDKSSDVHDYCRKYEKYLPFLRDDFLMIMEIGVLKGQSLRMWKEYFYYSHILGIDILPECKQYEEDRIKIEIGSQTDGEFLDRLGYAYAPFNIIIDDGSHINSDVIYSFEHLFQYVKSGGIYVIEDACTSYWPEYGGGRYKIGSTIEYFKSLIDDVNFFGEWRDEDEFLGYRRDKELIEQFQRKGYNHIETQIESINFLNSLIFITKR